MKNIKPISTTIALLGVLVTIGLSVYATSVGAEDLSSLSKKIGTQASAIAQLLSIAAYVAGVGFALGGILQFKAHKDAPQQTPLSKPIVMIVVAACLLFLPSILQLAGSSLGFTKSSAKAGDVQELGGS